MNGINIFVLFFSSIIFISISIFLFYLNTTVSDCVRIRKLENTKIEPKITQLPVNDSPKFITPWRFNSTEIDERAEEVKKMMKHAWDNYVNYAWGSDELRPILKRGEYSFDSVGRSKLGSSIVEAIDTLLIMGLDEEVLQGREWIKKNLVPESILGKVSTFNLNARLIGGLLSSYALTKDELFLQKAHEMIQIILPAFENVNGIPVSLVDPMNGESSNYLWASNEKSILAEVGSFHLEFIYMSALTGNDTYSKLVEKVRQSLNETNRPDGLYKNFIDPRNRQWGESK